MRYEVTNGDRRTPRGAWRRPIATGFGKTAYWAYDTTHEATAGKAVKIGQPPVVVALMGRPANGWKEWKSKFGGTLDDLKRHAADRASNDDCEDESKAR